MKSLSEVAQGIIEELCKYDGIDEAEEVVGDLIEVAVPAEFEKQVEILKENMDDVGFADISEITGDEDITLMSVLDSAINQAVSDEVFSQWEKVEKHFKPKKTKKKSTKKAKKEEKAEEK